MNTDLTPLEPHVRAILAEAPGNRVLLSQMGHRLRKRVADFTPESYGAPNLKALLQRMPLVGRLVQTSALEWWFAAGEVVVPPHDAPGERTSDKVFPRIERAWWSAITDFQDDRRAWFDLANDELSFDPEQVKGEPERFIELPRFGLSAQREIARAWCREQSPQIEQQCLTALNTDGTLSVFVDVVSRLGLRTSWAERRDGAISSALLRWADDHAIDHHLFVRSSPPGREIVDAPLAAPTSAAQAGPMFPGMTTAELRHLLHHAIEAMTEAELMQISIPARFLLRR